MRDCIARSLSRSGVPRAERGAAATEYALIIAGVALVVIFGAWVLGSFLDTPWASLLTWLD